MSPPPTRSTPTELVKFATPKGEVRRRNTIHLTRGALTRNAETAEQTHMPFLGALDRVKRLGSLPDDPETIREVPTVLDERALEYGGAPHPDADPSSSLGSGEFVGNAGPIVTKQPRE
ncbi:MAG: hypothetical protein IPJ41_09375 [Phycisphaerales bacterium]|nr:hypothetical protein [Phycisphaerales bacterium]